MNQTLLFIAPAEAGEAVLATAALEGALARMPEARVTIACAPGAEVLFRAAPGLDAVCAVADSKDWAALAWRHARRPFDLALDLRGAAEAYAVRARRRLRPSAVRVLRHRLEDYAEMLGAEAPLKPRIWLDDAARTAAAAIGSSAPLLVLAPDAPSAAQRWPAERFAAAARRLAGGPLAGAAVLVLGDVVGSAAAREVTVSLASDGIAARDISGALDVLGATALMERATLLIGNDGALIHAAAAMGAPVLGLFGPSDERVTGPRGPRTRALRGRAYEEIMALPVSGHDPALMDDLSIDAVEEAALDILRAGGLR